MTKKCNNPTCDWHPVCQFVDPDEYNRTKSVTESTIQHIICSAVNKSERSTSRYLSDGVTFIHLYGEVNEHMASVVRIATADHSRCGRLILWLDSPGGRGSVSDEIIDLLRETQKRGTGITTIILRAYSAALEIAACAGGELVAHPMGFAGGFGAVVSVCFSGRRQEMIRSSFTHSKPISKSPPQIYDPDDNPGSRAKWQEAVDNRAAKYLGRISAARGLSSAVMNNIATGRTMFADELFEYDAGKSDDIFLFLSGRGITI